MLEILTSGVALGVHVPGLLLADRLREAGAEVHISVLERFLPERTLATTTGMKWAFHRDFRFALAGQRLAGDASTSLPEQAQLEIMAGWRAREVKRFVVFSGFWLPVLERFGAEAVDVCHVDSVISPSFQKTQTSLDPRRIWLADADAGTIPFSIPVTREEPVAWDERDRRLLVHGGGWGMGTYRERAVELRAAGFALDVVAYEDRDAAERDPGVRYFMVDPDWHPWLDDGYPPFGEVTDPGSPPEYTRGIGHHSSFDLARTALATVSKPGGGTLLDSLWSATPTVLLEPFGAHERRNAQLWESLGFGISFERWQGTGFSLEVLADSHHVLNEARRELSDYSALLVNETGSMSDTRQKPLVV